MKQTWIYERISDKTGKTYWTLHKGHVIFGKLWVWLIDTDQATSDKDVMKKWKEFYNAKVYVFNKYKNKEVIK